MESTQIPRSPREGRTERLIFSHDLQHHEPSGLISGRGTTPLGRQDTKGARRMPWHRKSTKGAASCDKPRGGANGLRSGDSRMGEPARGHALAPPPEYIGRREATGGTETSKYPEEEKSNEIARVAASESAPSPNPRTRYSPEALRRGGRGPAPPGASEPGAR